MVISALRQAQGSTTLFTANADNPPAVRSVSFVAGAHAPGELSRVAIHDDQGNVKTYLMYVDEAIGQSAVSGFFQFASGVQLLPNETVRVQTVGAPHIFALIELTV